MRRRGTTTPRGLSARRRLAVVVGSAVVLAGLAGCSGEPRPTPSVTWTAIYETPWPGPEPTPTPTPTPSVSAPQRPEAMGEVSEAGAEAVARYFLDLYAYVYATGDLEAWRELSHPECVFCASVITNVEEQVAAGHRSEGSGMTIDSLSTVEIVAGNRYGVEARATQGPSRELDGDGVVVSERREAQAVVVVFALVYDGGWVVREVDATAPAES